MMRNHKLSTSKKGSSELSDAREIRLDVWDGFGQRMNNLDLKLSNKLVVQASIKECLLQHRDWIEASQLKVFSNILLVTRIRESGDVFTAYILIPHWESWPINEWTAWTRSWSRGLDFTLELRLWYRRQRALYSFTLSIRSRSCEALPEGLSNMSRRSVIACPVNEPLWKSSKFARMEFCIAWAEFESKRLLWTSSKNAFNVVVASNIWSTSASYCWTCDSQRSMWLLLRSVSGCWKRCTVAKTFLSSVWFNNLVGGRLCVCAEKHASPKTRKVNKRVGVVWCMSRLGGDYSTCSSHEEAAARFILSLSEDL